MSKKLPKFFCVYSREGDLIGTYSSISEIINVFESTTNSGVRAAIKANHIYKDMFFKEYNEEENILKKLKIDYLCKIDNEYFIRQIEVVRYLNVSRQLVSAAVKSRAKTIAGHEVEWFK